MSASRWIGAREPWASDTSRMIFARTVSEPMRVARKVRVPVVLSVPPTTRSSSRFATGRLSPVIIDSSTPEAPSVTTPSTAIVSPGRTRTRSPTRTSATDRSNSTPSRMTRAVRGARLISRRIASEVWLRARASRNRPSRMSVMIAAVVSKYIGSISPSMPRPAAMKNSGKRMVARL